MQSCTTFNVFLIKSLIDIFFHFFIFVSRIFNTQQILPKTSLVLRIDNTLLCIDYFSETALESPRDGKLAES